MSIRLRTINRLLSLTGLVLTLIVDPERELPTAFRLEKLTSFVARYTIS